MPVKIATIDDINEGHQVALRGFATRLLRLRHRLQLSQVELAQRIGAGRGSLANWELGVALPDLATICVMAERLGVTAEWLAFGKGNDIGPDTLLEERCVNVEVLDSTPDRAELVFDRQASNWLGLELDHCVCVRDSRTGSRGSLLLIDVRGDYRVRPGDYVFLAEDRTVTCLTVVQTGEGPRSLVAGNLVVVDEDIVGPCKGRITAEILRH